MICLDTNYLIMGLVEGSAESRQLLEWAEDGEAFCVSSIVWYEFLCGPITPEQSSAMRALVSEIVDFDEDMAATAAQLFNRIGRRGQLRVDTMIATTAIARDIPLATRNAADFAPFEAAGLQLVSAG